MKFLLHTNRPAPLPERPNFICREMTDQWTNFLNPDVIRRRFSHAGLFLVAYEMLQNAIQTPLHDLFSTSWTAAKGWSTSPEYRTAVLKLDPKGKNDVHRASIAWLLQNDILDTQDTASIRELTEERNRIAHEMRNFATGTNFLPFDRHFPELVRLITKIDGWWAINVSISTDPHFSDSDLDEGEIQPGSTIFLQILEQVALANDSEAWKLYNEFVLGMATQQPRSDNSSGTAE